MCALFVYCMYMYVCADAYNVVYTTACRIVIFSGHQCPDFVLEDANVESNV